MRLYLLPISTRRTLLYAQRLHDNAPQNSSLVDRATGFAAKTWATWEKKDRGWQRRVVDLGNQAFRRIPYEEWGLKSVPSLSTHLRALEHQKQKREQEQQDQKQPGVQGQGQAQAQDAEKLAQKVELVFPGSVIPAARAEVIARTLATERHGLHRQRMIWCFVGMPITVPFALIPVIPNIPFFYLAYRAFSHWRALSGGKHVQWLVERKLLVPTPSAILDKLYSRNGSPSPAADPAVKEQMLLTQDQVRSVSKTLNIPALEIELERAIWQVEQALQKAEKEKSQPSDSAEAVKKVDEKQEAKEKKDQ